jgi:hypothetical protein
MLNEVSATLAEEIWPNRGRSKRAQDRRAVKTIPR